MRARRPSGLAPTYPRRRGPSIALGYRASSSRRSVSYGSISILAPPIYEIPLINRTPTPNPEDPGILILHPGMAALVRVSQFEQTVRRKYPRRAGRPTAE